VPQTVYRITKTDPPTQEDFLSNYARGIPPRRSERTDPWEHEAISVFTRKRAARSVARAYPRLGEFLAQLVLPDELLSARTETRETPFKIHGPTEPGGAHYNMQGPPELFLRHVVSVEPVARKQT
jgi:hypothetical protein